MADDAETVIMEHHVRMGSLFPTLAVMESRKLDVPLTAIHMMNAETNAYYQFKVNDLHRRAKFGVYAEDAHGG